MNAWRAASLATQFGATVVGCISGGVASGIWLDNRAGTAPAFLLVGMLAGLIVSLLLIVAIYRLQEEPKPHRDG
jgi:F0F1-type ATP synthase assembly protein I